MARPGLVHGTMPAPQDRQIRAARSPKSPGPSARDRGPPSWLPPTPPFRRQARSHPRAIRATKETYPLRNPRLLRYGAACPWATGENTRLSRELNGVKTLAERQQAESRQAEGACRISHVKNFGYGRGGGEAGGG